MKFKCIFLLFLCSVSAHADIWDQPLFEIKGGPSNRTAVLSTEITKAQIQAAWVADALFCDQPAEQAVQGLAALLSGWQLLAEANHKAGISHWNRADEDDALMIAWRGFVNWTSNNTYRSLIHDPRVIKRCAIQRGIVELKSVSLNEVRNTVSKRRKNYLKYQPGVSCDADMSQWIADGLTQSTALLQAVETSESRQLSQWANYSSLTQTEFALWENFERHEARFKKPKDAMRRVFDDCKDRY